LTWYRNPQFQVRLKNRKQATQEKKAAVDAENMPSDLVSSFPFADKSDPAAGSEEDGSSVVARQNISLNINIMSATRSEPGVDDNPFGHVGQEKFAIECHLNNLSTGSQRTVFRTEASPASATITWNQSFTMKEFNGDEELVFHLLSIVGEDDEEVEDVVGEVFMPKIEHRHFEGPLGLLKVQDKESWGELVVKIDEMIEPGATTLAPPEQSKAPGSAGSEKDSKTGSRRPSKESKTGSDVPHQAALLMARLLLVDQNQKVSCAVHITKNHNLEEKVINENPFHHHVIASSGNSHGLGKQEYQIASEVGCVCKLIHGASEDEDGEPVHVIPSLDSKLTHGKFVLQLLATEDIIVERVN
jgi:hypothetical protein